MSALLTTLEIDPPLQVPLLIDLTAVAVGALAGANVAVRQRFDLVGTLTLAVLAGLGGGIIRDVLLGLRPTAISNRYFLLTVALAAVAGYLFSTLLSRAQIYFVILDALALGLFTIVGVEKGVLNGLWAPSAVFLGVAASVGGGVLLDLVAGQPVQLVHPGPWNATAALTGATTYTLAHAVGIPTRGCELVAFVLVVAMRLLSLGLGYRIPVPNPAPTETTQPANSPVTDPLTSGRHDARSRGGVERGG